MLLLLSLACDRLPDSDKDGWPDEVDCAPEDESVGFSESTAYVDADGDGYGGPQAVLVRCELPPGMVATSEDCDDLDPLAFPGAEERCDGADDDCDGEADEEAVDPFTWYPDSDEDSFGDESAPVQACDAPAGHVAEGGDCDDANPALNPDSTWYPDADQDGFGNEAFQVVGCEAPGGSTLAGGDCDDGDEAVFPGADEWCNERDDDCDDLVDDIAVDAPEWYSDLDGDGYGDEGALLRACTQPEGRIAQGGDCDDASADVHPGAPEVCEDEVDQDCNGVVDSSCYWTYDLENDASWGVSGGSSYDYFGASVAAGDLDGDGEADLAVGAYGDDEGASGAGAAFVFSDAGAGVTPDATLTGEATSDYAGYNLAILQDLDGDALPDLVVAAYGNDSGGTGAGRVYVEGLPASGALSGAGAVLTPCTSCSAGQYVLQGGDLDGDGAADLVLGGHSASSNAGQLAVYLGPLGAVEGTPDVTISGAASNFYLGYGAVVADFDGDGQDDLAGGTPGSDAGKVRIFLGPLTDDATTAEADHAIVGGETGDFFGSKLASGDFDGDGAADLVVGAKYESSGSTDGGAIYVFAAPLAQEDASEAEFMLVSDQSADYLGHQSATVLGADLNLDGRDDLVAGWPSDDTVHGDAGSVLVVYGLLSGTFSTTQADAVIQGEQSNAEWGRSVATADFDADGLPDLAIGGAYGTTFTGEVAIFPGSGL